jgi:hypothetical protein
MKSINKIIALRALPVGIALAYAMSAIHVWEIAGDIIALSAASILFGVEAAVVESYTKGYLELEIEFEPPEPELKNA